MRKTILRILLVAVILPLLHSCSGSGEAKTRKEQETEFTNAFGFSPPHSVTEIRYSDLYNRGVTDGAYGQWMRFTYSPELLERIISTNRYPAPETKSISLPNKDVAPSWWTPKVDGQMVIYTRTEKDTPDNEGFSFEESLWHDKASGFIYFEKSYWD